MEISENLKKKVDDTFNLKAHFGEHLSKFGIKNEHELAYLEDVRTFIEKKSQLELQYSQALSKLCSQFTSKEQYQLNDDSNSEILIPEKWKLILEQYAYMAEKKQVSSKSLLMHCEYFKKMKEQKSTLNQMALVYLKKNHNILSESNRNCQIAFKNFCIDQFLCDQFEENKVKVPNLEKKLKEKNINVNKFKKALDEMNKDDQIHKERLKKLDFSKLNYVTTNFCQNQQIQYYYSMEIPQLLNLQNGQIDAFINESLNTLVLKDIESSKFFIKHFDSLFGSGDSQEVSNQRFNSTNNSSEAYFIDRNDCFSNLIQYDLQPHDNDFQPSFFSFQNDNLKSLSNDYVKWTAKLNEVEKLMTAMLTKVNEQKIVSTQEPALGTDFSVDLKQEECRFLLAEKKLQMIFLQAKIDALGSFNINLNELDTDLYKFEDKPEFGENLHQNFELWDKLMSSIDKINYLDESYEYDLPRKSSKDFIQSDESIESRISFSIFDPNVTEIRKSAYTHLPNVEAKFARTTDNFVSNDQNYLSFDSNQSLIIYDEIFNGVYRAKNYKGLVGLVSSKYLEFYQEEPVYVKSVYVYDGLDEQELSFPPEAYIRLLRKNFDKKKIDNEEWWEGVYEDKVGFFPSIFVQPVEKSTNNNEANQACELPSSPVQITQQHEQYLSPYTENQKVPQ